MPFDGQVNKTGATSASAPEIVQDLSEAINGVFVALVEAVDENQSLLFVRLSPQPGERGDCLILADDISLEGHKIHGRIAGKLLRPLNLADLAVCVRRNRNDHVCVGRLWGAAP